jgi:hypothetical protein
VDSWHGPFSILLLQVVFILEYIVNSSSGSKWIVGMVLFQFYYYRLFLF